MDARPRLVWIGDPLSPWRAPRADARLVADLEARSGWSIATVDLGPESVGTFPWPLTQAYRTLVELQAGAAGPVAIGGHGFGAGLAAAASILARRYEEVPLAATVLLAPLLDPRFASPSWQRLASEERRRELEAAFAAYAPGLDRADPLLSPLHAEDLSGLPPTVIVTAERDPMRDDGERYAERLRGAGVTVLGHRYPATDHAEACSGETSAEGAAVVKGLAAALRLILSRSTEAGERSSSHRADAAAPG